MSAVRVLVACESSGVVREAFRAAGHDAMSCDLLPSELPGPHYEGDVRDLVGESWDLVIADPPCTFLALSGVRWLSTDPARWDAMRDGARFFASMFEFETPRLAVENPVQHRYALAAHGMGRPTQLIQPWEFGHMESKATCLWLKGLPPLLPTELVREAMLALPKHQRQRIHHMPPGPERWRERSRTYAGIARAMAEQWTAVDTLRR